MVTEPTLDDAADYRFDNLYRVNWIEKLPDYQYQCFYLRFHQIYDTFVAKINLLYIYYIVYPSSASQAKGRGFESRFLL